MYNMEAWSDMLNYFMTLMTGDLPKVKYYVDTFGADVQFSSSHCGMSWFFETFIYQNPPDFPEFWESLLDSCVCRGDVLQHKNPAASGETSDSSDKDKVPVAEDGGYQPGSSEKERAEWKARGGVRPLHIACGHGFTDIVKLLVDRGASLEAVSLERKETPLQIAIKSPRKECIAAMCELLVGAGAELIDAATAATPSYYIETPVHRMSLHGDVDVLRALLSARDQFPQHVALALRSPNARGEFPLNCAVRGRSPECIELLVGAGAEINVLSTSGFSPLMQATEIGDTETIDALLKFPGCDVNCCSPLQKLRAIHIAVSSGNRPVVERLLAKGADIEAYDHAGITPLMYTAFNGREDIARLLLDQGAAVDHATILRYAAMHHAAWEGNMSVVLALLEGGARYDDRTSDGNTPLALAAHGGHSDVVRLLVGKGCNINNADRDSDTPLMYAAYNGDIDSVRTLVEHGADASRRNRVDAAAVWNAAYGGHIDVIRYLVRVCNPPLSIASRGIDQHFNGAEPPCLYLEPRTPLYVTVDRSRLDIAELLMAVGASLCSERWLWDGELPASVDEACRLRLEDAARCIPPLVNLTRDAIRRFLGSRAFTVIPDLEIPNTLKDVLLLRDLV